MKEGSRAISNARACACARARGAASRLTSRRSGMRLPCTREKKNPSGLRERARGVRCTSVPQSAGRFYDRDQKHEDVPGSYEITLRIATNNFEGIPFLFFFFFCAIGASCSGMVEWTESRMAYAFEFLVRKEEMRARARAPKDPETSTIYRDIDFRFRSSIRSSKILLVSREMHEINVKGETERPGPSFFIGILAITIAVSVKGHGGI